MTRDPSELGIRRRLARYLTGRQSLNQFYGWLALATWDIHEREPRRVQQLAYKIKLLVAEFTNGDWTEQELRNKLRWEL